MLFSTPSPTARYAVKAVDDTGSSATISREQKDTKSVDKEIVDIKKIPQGTYVRFSELGIPESFDNSFVCLKTGPNSAVLLIASDAWSSHPQFELSRRLKDSRIFVSNTYRASREMVKSLHRMNDESDDQIKKKNETTEIEDFAWKLIDRAIEMETSDIHIESRSTYAQIFYRIYGERIEQANISKDTALEICNVLYGFHADSSSKTIAWDIESVHDTSIEHQSSNGKAVQLRFSSGPIHPGGNFHAVIRILVMDSSSKPLEKVGYAPQQISIIEEMLTGAQGMVLLVGPTNSGKSTSMQAIMNRIFERRGRDIKAITVEDPVEYLIPGACQMGVPKGRKSLEDADGSVYSTFLKATLRQDPDVVMVGEVRDGESAGAIKNLVLAGRKLLTTLHVYEAFSVYQRLLELGVPSSVLMMEGFISGIIFQRLVPVICPKCSIPVEAAFEQGIIRTPVYNRVMRVSDLSVHDVRVRCKSGCAHCNYTGIVGRSPCAAILVPDTQFLTYMRAGNEMAARDYWHSNAEQNIEGLGVTAVSHAIYKMRQGIHDPSDIETQIGAILVHDTGVLSSNSNQ